MNASVHRQLNRRKRSIVRRIRNRPGVERAEPMLAASNIHYQFSDRIHAIAPGGIGAIHLMAQKIGLVHDIDEKLHLLKRHLPYHESDHVLSIAYNLLAGGSRLEHLEIRRNDEVYLDALGAERIPDPTTAGDFCRRFAEADVGRLMEAFNQTRLRVWDQQPAAFSDHALIDADGTLAPTSGWCKQGVDIAYDGTWGYHPLVVSLANTGESLYLVNRSGNRPSHEDAHTYLDKAIALCRRGGFKKITLRGDTDFTQTKHLDRWDDDGVGFLFGTDARANLVELAERLPADAYAFLERPVRYSVATSPRSAREDHKSPIVVARQFETIRCLGEEVAEFDYRPLACERAYRVIVLRKHLARDEGQMRLFEEYRYFFFLTNDRTTEASELVLLANDRCDQENLIAQLKGGVKALSMPVDNLVSNWAYMVMASPGVGPEGVGSPDAARGRSLGGEVPDREAFAGADGVQHVLRGDDPGAVPGREDGSADRVSIAVMEPLAGCIPATGGEASRSAVVLRVGCCEAGVGMSRSVMAPNDERRCADGRARKRRWEPGRCPGPERVRNHPRPGMGRGRGTHYACLRLNIGAEVRFDPPA